MISMITHGNKYSALNNKEATYNKNVQNAHLSQVGRSRLIIIDDDGIGIGSVETWHSAISTTGRHLANANRLPAVDRLQLRLQFQLEIANHTQCLLLRIIALH